MSDSWTALAVSFHVVICICIIQCVNVSTVLWLIMLLWHVVHVMNIPKAVCIIISSLLCGFFFALLNFRYR